jgi:putative hydrolase of the HAD superfamily
VRYPFVLLDVGDTLISARRGFGDFYAEQFAASGLDLPAERWDRAMRATWSEVSTEHRPGTDRYSWYPGGEQEFWLRFATRTAERAAGEPVAPELVAAAVQELRDLFTRPEAWLVHPEVPGVLEQLQRAGVVLGVVSNWDSRLPRLLATLGLDRYFDAVVVSHLEGLEKPDARLFRRALAALGADPWQTVYVGDVPELDLAGGRAAGLDVLLVDRRGRHPGWRLLDDLSVLPQLALAA